MVVKHYGGPNQTSAEKGGDDLWIAEKFQSNPDIAGSPRNSFRASSAEKGGDDLWIAEKFQSSSDIAGSPRNSFRASLGLV